ncbi:hypothetical protein [Raineyella fluvialis]|uniref:Uncharacterized protein n=1 Tax=Raineyella fluvialis TaxID=2662261 RepID=A0A5Q2F8N7_9ACTN|nr:hypothetical protein [Raineyella fluvialis]QGF23028.1 hypothetical protein Rai3103_04385 [Raineyella fluvialis]
MKVPIGSTRIPDTVPRPILVVARTRLPFGRRRAGAVRGVVTLAHSRPWYLTAVQLVSAPGSFPVVGRDHRRDLKTIDRVTATWPDRERLDTLQRAGRDPRWARWTADGMRERHEDDRRVPRHGAQR